MNNSLKLSKLGLSIAAAILIAGCNSESAQTSSESSDSVVARSAEVTLGVKFPQSEAGAAWIGDSQEIQVSFYNTKYLGSVDEAEDALDALYECQGDDWEGSYTPDSVFIGDQELTCDQIQATGTRGDFATKAYLTASSPTSAVQLNPGKYRVEASFYDANNKLQETSVSYVTLGEGSHNLKLRGIEATWTATTPITLQLLNQTSEIDWDWNKEGVQTPADAMGITGTINGLHLPSALTYPDSLASAENGYGDQLSWSDFMAKVNLGLSDADIAQQADKWDGGLTLQEHQLATLFQPVLRVNDGSGEVNILPKFEVREIEHQVDENWSHYSSQTVVTNLGYLLQEYAQQGDLYGLSLGYMSASTEEYNEQTNEFTRHFSFLEFGVPHVEEPEELGTEYTINFYENPTYWNGEEQVEYPDLTIADISTFTESGADWKSIFQALQGQRTEIVNGSTISGSFIEVRGSWSWSGDIDGQPTAPTPYLDASLNAIAVQAGLMSQPANNCQTFEYGNTHFSNEYKWDEANQRWIAGTFNQLLTMDEYGIQNDIAREKQYAQENSEFDPEGSAAKLAELEAVETELLALADLNQDGTAELFEEGVYVEGELYCNLAQDWNNTESRYSYSLSCGEFTVADTVPAWTNTENVTMCLQPFELTASQLALDLETDADIGIE
ncbi:hypothetical protein SE23_01990 [Vibrio sinaloensis]|uniref:hypothetical protein n=1 Tax=Photobacterium sp. (strain ATCC 43367) TaxID=379097 RepID=UPI00057F3E47|nr:hypothetical protein [Vibrio sinaloensis]KIE22286.1 hypothetical protein SE23_01990 [Vibrio sinaloensis]